MELNLELGQIKQNDLYSKDFQKKIKEIYGILKDDDKSKGTAWVDYPTNYDKKEMTKINKLAKNIRSNSDVLLVVGIGGSYLGAKAGIEMLAKKSQTEIVFAGINFDYTDLNNKLENLKNKDVTVNVISKSGTTVEILMTLSIIERFLKNKYKGLYKERLIFTTDKNKGYLRERAILDGIETLTVPDNIGGRYSVLSAVGMLPFAVADINIKKIFEGAVQAQNDFDNDDIYENKACQYAIYRYLINKKLNKKIELFSSFFTSFNSFGFWLQQLFCESEGKDGEGLFVVPLAYSTDLHSVGQFIQQGSPIVAETFLTTNTISKDNSVTNIALKSPIKYLDGKSFFEVNKAAENATIKAHSQAKVPISVISIDEINEYNFGYLVYFFEYACAVSGYLLKINPFNQPGVEQYKKFMRENLQ